MADSCKYADVIVDITHEKLDKTFTYRIPENLLSEVRIGSPVIISFGNAKKEKLGYVTGIHDELPDTTLTADKIKNIISVAEKDMGTEGEFIELARWMHERYGCTMNKALKTVLPVKKVVKARNGSPVNDDYPEYRLNKPTAEQQAVIDAFISDYDRGIRRTYLLFGVTGSGKTDVYIHMIKHVIEKGRKVILLIPEIGLSYQTVARLYSVFGRRLALIHSKLSPGERYEEFRRCKSGEADIIIGPRSAVFAPLKDIGLIVIDEEHDAAYKNENIPRFNTIDVAEKRAEVHGASMVLASATPSPASYKKAIEGDYRLLTLKERPAGAELPDIELVDMREELSSGNRSIFSRRLDELIRDRLDKKQQVILFMNRRGYSNFVSCRSCGNAVRCPHCDVSLTLHKGHRLVCHYCGYEQDQPEICPVCSSPYIAEFGTGTQKLESIARRMYPQARISRLDTDSTSAKNSAEEILKNMSAGNTDILIGTQMVVKGHDFPGVTLVGIMAADTSLYMSSYDSAERTYELITQAAGRAGRKNLKGTVVVQTYKPDHYAIDSCVKSDYEEYIRNEIAFRKLLSYPPAVHIWSIQLSSKNEEKLEAFAQASGRILAEEAEEYSAQIIGPVNCEIYKIQDFFRKMIYVKNIDYDRLIAMKDRYEKRLSELGGDGDISCMYDFT